MAERTAQRILVGRVRGLYGVRGWVKISTHTERWENILAYTPWQLCVGGTWRTTQIEDWRWFGKGLAVKLDVCDDRDTARRWMGADIAVFREQLPTIGDGEYYWADLVGLQVINREGVELGCVDRLMETGANDVLIIRGDRERLVPFLLKDVVLDVDLVDGLIRVNWDEDF